MENKDKVEPTVAKAESTSEPTRNSEQIVAELQAENEKLKTELEQFRTHFKQACETIDAYDRYFDGEKALSNIKNGLIEMRKRSFETFHTVFPSIPA